jgi:hypothetical protein
MSQSQVRTREDGTIFQITMGVNTAQVIVWDRGRPARNAPQARSLWKLFRSFSRFALICGRDARGPRQSIDA